MDSMPRQDTPLSTKQLSHFEVVVLGGGPAGSAASQSAQALGLSTLLIDKRTFPREKLCGGLLTPRSKAWVERIFEGGWPEGLVTSADTMAFSSRGRHLATQEHYQTLFFSMRYDFDHHLIQMSQRAGVTMHLGTSATQINLEKKTIILSDDTIVTFNVLIGADGVNSQVAKLLFGSSFNPQTIGFGLEVEVPKEHLPAHGDVVEIDFSGASWGYGWVFPKKRSFTIGVGGIHVENPDLKANLRSYLESKQLDPGLYKVKGHFIPFGDYRRKPGDGAVLLCGDAAGVVDPITGEGIAYALETGYLAAQAAAAAIRKGDAASAYALYEAPYLKAVDSLSQANRWRNLIFPKRVRRLFEWAFRDAGTLQQGYLDILAGRREYKDLYWLFVKQAGKAITKPFRVLLRRLRPN